MIETRQKEVRFKTSDPLKMLNMFLPNRLLRTWKEDFVNEETNEVTTIERNEVILERGTILDQEAISLIKFHMEAKDITEVEVSNQRRMAYEVENNCIYPFEAQAMVGDKKIKFLLHANNIDRASLVMKDFIELNYRDPFWLVQVKQFTPCVILTDTLKQLKQDAVQTDMFEESEEEESEDELTDKDKKFYQIETKIECEDADGKWEVSQEFVIHTFDTPRAMILINRYLQEKEKESREKAIEREQTRYDITHTPVIETVKTISVGCYIPREFSSAYFKRID